jgi:4-amino-4-deoxy-L-arabinose transferase-like glycosyltransferase
MSTTTVRRPRPLPAASDRLRGIVRGDARDAAWARPALIALLAITAIAYLWDLTASGDANSFYAAAVQAGTKSWKALFFGSLDSSSFITVDKPPASLWVMALSGRIFGFSSASMLIPSVVEGVAAVTLLHAAVKRWFGASAGLLAGLLLAVTPVAALMFRFNNPDALLVMLMVAGAYCLVRAVERGSTRWLLAAGTMIGFAFLAKMMQAFLVLPAFALVYLVAAPTTVRRRVWQLLAAGLAVVISAGWWVAIVALWPAGSRPMIDGSPDNNIFNLITGYNGLGRIFGASSGGGGGGGNFSGATGPLRLFNSLMGGQASWLLPAALICLVAGLWFSQRAPRTDRTRAAMLLWGGWLLVTGLVFSYGSGVIHTYYTVALAPAIAALVAIGATQLWRERDDLIARVTMAGLLGGTAAWSWVLLDRTPSWEPWLRWLVVVSAAAAVAGLLAAPWLRRIGRRVLPAVAVVAIVTCLAGPTAYAAQTLTTAHTGSVPSAGPSSGSGFAGGGGPPGAAARGSRAGGSAASPPAGGEAAGGSAAGGSAPGGSAPGGMAAGGQTQTSAALVKALEAGAGRYRWVAAVSGSQSAASLELATGGDPVMAIGGFNGEGGHLSLAQFKRYVAAGEIHYYIASTGAGASGVGVGSGRPGAAGTTGGASNTTGGAPTTAGGAPSTAGGAPSTAGGAPTTAGGPPTGDGPSTGGSASGATSARSGGAGFPAGAGRPDAGAGGPGGYSASSITSWVKAHYKRVTIGGQTVYDLGTPK